MNLENIVMFERPCLMVVRDFLYFRISLIFQRSLSGTLNFQDLLNSFIGNNMRQYRKWNEYFLDLNRVLTNIFHHIFWWKTIFWWLKFFFIFESKLVIYIYYVRKIGTPIIKTYLCRIAEQRKTKTSCFSNKNSEIEKAMLLW